MAGFCLHEGREHYQKAKVVIVAGYAIETPRLLLNSACPGHENGLANSSDTVGRCLMAQAGNVILGRFARRWLLERLTTSFRKERDS